MGEYQRDAFLEAFDVDKRAETACVRRLITGEGECPHSPLEGDDDLDGPPHAPPASDYATLWLDDGEPALYSMHVYPGSIERLGAEEPPYNQWFDLFEFASTGGWKSQSCRSPGTTSGARCTSSFTRLSGIDKLYRRRGILVE